MVKDVGYLTMKNPVRYFRHSPAMFSHTPERFVEVAENGAQKTLWNMMNNLTRDWYWFLCREFDLKAYNIEAGFFYKNTKNRLGDAWQTAAGKFPNQTLKQHYIRYNLAHFRAAPLEMYFDTIPHEVAHCITAQIYWNEIYNLGHGQEWQEIMSFIGLGTNATTSLDEPVRKNVLNCCEDLNQNLTLRYSANETW